MASKNRVNKVSVAFGLLGLLAGYLLGQLLPRTAGQESVSILREPLEIQAKSEAGLAKGPFFIPPGTALQFVEKSGADTAIYSMRIEVHGQRLSSSAGVKEHDLLPVVAVQDPEIDERLPNRNP